MALGISPQSAAPENVRPHQLAYDGRVTEIGWIALVNAVLGLLTLGVYRFWGKTRLRRHIWSRLAFDGDRLEYTGRGVELFIGFLVAIAILALLQVVVVGASFALGLGIGGENPLDVVFLLVVVFLIPMAIYRARRYRLSRTKWRGIRAGQTGSAVKYAAMVVGLQILTGITIGLAFPFMRTVLQRYRTENTWFGNQACQFDGSAGDLFGKWFIAWLLIPFTLGISYVWYRVVEFRYYTSQVRFAGLRFASDLHTARFMGIALLYALAVAVFLAAVFAVFVGVAPVDFAQLGAALGTPGAGAGMDLDNAFVISVIVMLLVAAMGLSLLRTMVFLHPLLNAVTESLSVTGRVDFGALAQRAGAGPGHGEGLADALDVGAF